MSLASLIHVNTSYTRSINLERDNTDIARSYILTSRAMQILPRISETLGSSEVPRAWALIGPYGTGKSAFGLFLAQLLGNRNVEAACHAQSLLQQEAPELAERFNYHLAGTKGYCVAVLTGSPEPFVRRLTQALHLAAEQYFSGPSRGGKARRIRSLLDQAVMEEQETSYVIELISELQAEISKANGAGLLIVIDELGKFLEYEARQRGASDIYLLQALAEHAFRADTAPLQLVVLLHQSFEQYAQTLGEQLRNEWKKVQGRFESIPFLETTEQVIRVVKAALQQRLEDDSRSLVEGEARKIARILADQHALPLSLNEENATVLFAGCYPIHPVSLLLLPTLCQRVAQNERTLFSYLGSHEPHGFLENLSRLNVGTDRVEWIEPWEIYDYFIRNQPGLITDNLTHRRWAEVVTALERLGDAPENVGRMLKTIGLMNIVGAQGGLKASPEILALSTADGDQSKKILKQLTDQSLITFRRFNGEYRVWQGSDFDLEGALAEQLAQVRQFDIADLLNQAAPLAPIVARRHAIKTGTMRYFSPVFISAKSIGQIRPTDTPTLFICLAETNEDSDKFKHALTELGKVHAVGVIVGNPEALRELVLTVYALLRVQRESAALASDPVAQRELKDRLGAAKRMEIQAITAVLENPTTSEWIFHGRIPLFNSKRELQQKLSEVLDEVYGAAPRLHNELINRDKPSASAIAGRNKLLAAMFSQSVGEDLGIEKYPAEKSMYRALLRATGLHHRQDSRWQFGLNPAQRDEYQLKPLWTALDEWLEGSEATPLRVDELFKRMSSPPFGIKLGAIPILFLAYFLANQDELALFEEGYFCPFLTQETYERLLKNPKAFGLQRFRIENYRENLFRRYAEIVSGEQPDEATLLAAVKPLAKMMVNLPEYTKKTKRLSPEAIAVRDLFFASKSPARLLLADLPAACGIAAPLNGNTSTADMDAFTHKFQAVIREIKGAYHRLLWDFQEMLKRAFGIESKVSLNDLRDVLRGRCLGLDQYTIDVHGLRAFIIRVTDKYGDETPWLISVASFLGRKPPEKWMDDDIKTVEFRLVEFARSLRDLERIRFVHQDRIANSDAELDVIMLKTVDPKKGEEEHFIRLDKINRHATDKLVHDILQSLRRIDEELQLVAVARILQGISDVKTESGVTAQMHAEVQESYSDSK